MLFVHHYQLIKNIDNYKKLAINSMIGNFKTNLFKRENWNSTGFTDSSCDALTVI
jgi:hypothetical protein